MRGDIEQLIDPDRSRSIPAVVGARGFGAAAAEIGVSQSAMGRQVRRLERLSHRGLFRRDPEDVERAPAPWVES